MSTDQFRDLAIVANAAGPVEAADDLLAARCDWIACPTCGGSGRTARPMGPMLRGMFLDPCPDCDGTGHPTVAQVLAWGEAVATAMPAPSIEGMIAPVYMEGYQDRLDALRAVKP